MGELFAEVRDGKILWIERRIDQNVYAISNKVRSFTFESHMTYKARFAEDWNSEPITLEQAKEQFKIWGLDEKLLTEKII